MKQITLFLIAALTSLISMGQRVGIGTTTPHSSAALEIKATDKGVLFPSINTAQRDAIPNPANGLHIYNTDERCLNVYDGLFHIWESYCDPQTITIRIKQDVSGGLDFYNTYAKNYPGITRFAIIIEPGVNLISSYYYTDPILGELPLAALNFRAMPTPTEIRIINYGNIVGLGGKGGDGARGAVGDNASCIANGKNGYLGGVAILATSNTQIQIENYGTISGGGGGGHTVAGQYGGGGGGGAYSGGGGAGGGTTQISIICINNPVAQNGSAGNTATGGPGGAGANGGGNGGKGGDLAQSGAPGTGANAGSGGAAGITVMFLGTGSSGIIINNHGSGQVLGVVQ